MSDIDLNIDISDSTSDTNNYEGNEEYQKIIENINLCRIIETKYKEWLKNLENYIDKNLESLYNYITIQEEFLNKIKNNSELFQNNFESSQNDTIINNYLQSINEAINIQNNKKDGIENTSYFYLKLLDNIKDKNIFSFDNNKNPERQLTEINDLKQGLNLDKNVDNSEKIENMKKIKLIHKNQDKERMNSEYTCFSPLDDKKYMVFGNKKGEIEIYDFTYNDDSSINEESEEKYKLQLRISVFDDEVKYICELDEDLLAVSERKNIIKIIKCKDNISDYSIIQTIYIDDYDDLYIYSMISLPLLSSQEKRHFLCIATDNQILIYKSNKIPKNININDNGNNEQNLYFEKYKDIKLNTLVHCLIESDNKYLVVGCPNEKAIKFYDMTNDFRQIANITEIKLTSGSNIFTLIPNKNLLVVACYDGFKIISIKKKKIIKSYNEYTILSLDMFNDNTIICCSSKENNNIINQYEINQSNFELKIISQRRTNNNDEIWKLQKINKRIFFLDNKKNINFLA